MPVPEFTNGGQSKPLAGACMPILGRLGPPGGSGRPHLTEEGADDVCDLLAAPHLLLRRHLHRTNTRQPGNSLPCAPAHSHVMLLAGSRCGHQCRLHRKQQVTRDQQTPVGKQPVSPHSCHLRHLWQPSSGQRSNVGAITRDKPRPHMMAGWWSAQCAILQPHQARYC